MAKYIKVSNLRKIIEYGGFQPVVFANNKVNMEKTKKNIRIFKETVLKKKPKTFVTLLFYCNPVPLNATKVQVLPLAREQAPGQ